MARPYRLQLENCIYHITSRGDDRKKVFISKYDFEKFLEYIKSAKEKHKFYLYAYVLMSNHYHLLLETSQPNLSKIMHYINTSYTVYYNTKRRRSGHVFQGRYKSIIVDGDSYFLELSRYIHLNPVRAKIVNEHSEYKWSSYSGYIKKKGDGYIDKERMRNYIDMSVAEYRKFVLSGIGEDKNPFAEVYAGFILGKTKFIKERLEDLKGQVEGEVSHKKVLTSCTDIESIVRLTADKYRDSVEDIYKAKKKPLLSKKIAVYLSKRLTGLTNREIGG
ncbi:MAG: transposase, partial [Candidatus Caldatribacteriota bacterium]|nr:transposase [Candidatus Caldatribacteriota bacterium]